MVVRPEDRFRPGGLGAHAERAGLRTKVRARWFHRQSGPRLEYIDRVVAGSLGDRAQLALVVIQRPCAGLRALARGTDQLGVGVAHLVLREPPLAVLLMSARQSGHRRTPTTYPRCPDVVLTSTWWLPIVAARYIDPILLPP